MALFYPDDTAATAPGAPGQDQNDLLRRLSQLGTLPARQQQLQDLLSRAYALQGPGQRYGTGLGAALGGIGNVLRNIAGFKQQNAILGQQQALNQEQAGTAQQLGQVLQQPLQQPEGAATGNATDDAMAAYRQRLERDRNIGTLAALAGPKTNVGSLGDILLRRAESGEQGLMGLQVANINRQAQRDFLESLAKEKMENQRNIAAAQLGLKAEEVGVNPETGQLYRKHAGGGGAGGPLRNVGATPAAPGAVPAETPPPGGRQGQQLQKAANQLNADLDAYKRGSGLQQIGMTQNRAAKLKALIVDPATGKIRDQITPQQMYEVTIALQQMVATGQPSEQEVAALLPKSAQSDVARAVQYFTGHPMDANQKEWAKNILDSAEREAGVSQDYLNSIYLTRIPANFQTINKLHPPTLQGILRGHGMDPNAFDAQGVVRPGARPIIPKRAPEDEQAINWAKANPQDPNAAKILQLHGVQ